MKKKRIFIAYSSKDQDIVDIFIGMLEVALENKRLINQVEIVTMDKFPQHAHSEMRTNAEEIGKSDIFILLFSPFFVSSTRIMDKEASWVLNAIENNEQKDKNKIAYFIKLNEIGRYKGEEFINVYQFFKSKRVPELTCFNKKEASHIDAQRAIFVEDLVSSMEPYINATNAKYINYLRDIPHIDDFIKGRKRKIRVCKKDDTLINAEFFMYRFPPVRHLLVIDENEELNGVLSIRDILKFAFDEELINEGNLTFMSEEGKSKKVYDYYTKKEDLIYFSLDRDNKIEDVIKPFIKSPDIGHPVGILPVLKHDKVYTKGEFEILSYIDILKSWEKLPVASKLRSIKVTNFPEQSNIQVVVETDEVSLANKYMNQGRRTLPVVNHDGLYTGIISDSDLLGIEEEKYNYPVASIMKNKDSKVIIKDGVSFKKLVDQFLENRDYTSLPVLDNEGKIKKMIGYTDLLKCMHEALIEE